MPVGLLNDSAGQQKVTFRGNGWESAPILTSSTFLAFEFGGTLDHVSVTYPSGFSNSVSWPNGAPGADSLLLFAHAAGPVVDSVEFVFSDPIMITAADRIDAAVPEPDSTMMLAGAAALSGLVRARRRIQLPS